MHSNNTTQTCMHCTHTEYTHSNPPYTPTISHPPCFVVIYTAKMGKGLTFTPRRDTQTHGLQAKKSEQRGVRVFLMLNILRTHIFLLAANRQTNHRNNHSLNSGCSPNES